ncbi:hemolysin XhlA family protein [Liquorilactobacillus capillatus]|uniref:Holin n=1 Tax=Liquorilactobacillus capillatus DSM 19910 TaxID=1423731 RepID=A0A0R1M9Q6_9LACO|nr:hemolysin XhlA family protein [Liquorilactobacillus capillatus]KRL02532.1 hypothetical protein FC81_GL000700 [Liquorilactobacillus capillatus DSM 19910]
MQEKEDVNVIELLMDIQQRLAKVETNTSGLNKIGEKADKAYAMSKQNAEDIKDIKSDNKWNWRTTIVAIVIPIALYLVEKFI